MKSYNDKELVEQLKKHDPIAFDILYQRYYKLVAYLAYQLTHSHADTQEIVQEVFIKIYRYIDQIKDAKQLKYWISSITHNECKQLFRKHKECEMDMQKFDQLYQKQEDRLEFTPQKFSRYQSDKDVLAECIAQLKPEHREVLVLKYFMQLSLNEIASLLKIPNGTVKSRMAYAKKELKSIIMQYEKENNEKLTFHVFGIGSVCAMYFFKQRKRLQQGQKTMLLSNPSIVMCGITACIITLAGTWMYVQDAEGKSENNTMQARTESFDAKQAYTTLKQWAHCEKEVREKSQSEKAAMRELYEQLKTEGNGYFTLLQTTWKNAFEESE